MLRIKKKIYNPMTIIATFAIISETSAMASLPFLGNKEREIYVWFLISFPFYLLFLFFITLNFNYRSLYAPSDFSKDENFLTAIERGARPEQGYCATVHAVHGSTLHPPDPCASDCPVSLVRHNVLMPARTTHLDIVDTCGMNQDSQLTTLLENYRCSTKQSSRTILILVDDVSEGLLNGQAFRTMKNAKRSTESTFCIAYNVGTKDMTVLGLLRKHSTNTKD